MNQRGITMMIGDNNDANLIGQNDQTRSGQNFGDGPVDGFDEVLAFTYLIIKSQP